MSLILVYVFVCNIISAIEAVNNMPSFAADVASHFGARSVTFVNMCNQTHAATKDQDLTNFQDRLPNTPIQVMNMRDILDSFKERPFLHASLTIIGPGVESKLLVEANSMGFFETVTSMVSSENTISDLQLKLNSRFYTYHMEEESTILINETYEVKHDLRISKPIGKWTMEEGLHMVNPFSIAQRRQDLMGRELLNARTTQDPSLRVTSDGQIKVIGKFGSILDILQEAMNATFNYYIPRENITFGRKLSNGTFSGLLGMIQQQETELIGLFMRAERSEIGEFSFPLYKDLITLITARNPKRVFNIWAFFHIFSLESWLTILGFSIIIAMCLMVTDLLQVKIFKSKSDYDPIIFSVSTTVAVILQAAMLKAHPAQARSNTLKLLLWILMLTFLVCHAFFAAILTSFVTVLEPAPEIKSYDDFIQSDLEFKANTGSSIVNSLFVRSQPPSPYHALYEAKIKNNPKVFTDTKTLIESAESGEAIIFGPINSFKVLSKNLKAIRTPETLRQYVALLFPKNSELELIFNYSLLKLYETGLMARIRRQYSGASLPFGQEADLVADTLDYQSLMLPFIFLIFGSWAALLQLLCENCIHKLGLDINLHRRTLN